MGFRSILKYIAVKWLRSARRKNEIGRQTDKLRHSFSKKDPDSIISINLRHFSNPPSGGVRMPRAKVINSLSSRYWKQYQSILLLVVDERRGRKVRGSEGTHENEMTAFDRRNIRLVSPSDVQFWQFCRLKQTSKQGEEVGKAVSQTSFAVSS